MKTIKLILSMIVMFLSFMFLYRSMTLDGLNLSVDPVNISAFGWLIGLMLFLIAGTMGLTASQNDQRRINLATAYFYFAAALVTLVFAQRTMLTISVAVISGLVGGLFFFTGLGMESEALDLNWYEKKSRERKNRSREKYQQQTKQQKSEAKESYQLGEMKYRKTARRVVLAFFFTGVLLTIVISAVLVSVMQDEESVTDEYSDYYQYEEEAEEETVDVYELGQTWTVENDFSITFTAANETSYRNEYAEFDPEQVLILTYDYSNLGHEKDTMDLYISYINFYVLDENDEWGEYYSVLDMTYPEEIAIGETCTGAQESFGLYNESQEVWVYVEVYGNDYEYYAAYFWLPVQPEEVV
ncbi:hypothetical protein Q5O24_00395 [Eubacteriaceae bacterium ES3]|nr:hypothetical protein Q5O24_00395 [Eubacteriaceae bacterium ES3]